MLGRIVADPEIRRTASDKPIANYRMAVNRTYKREGEPTADFLNCVAFGRNAEFAEKHMRKGAQFLIVGHIQTGSYTNREGQKVYTTDIIVDEQYFTESKGGQAESKAPEKPKEPDYGQEFMSIPEGEDGDLPFN